MQQIDLIERPAGLTRAQARADAMRAAKKRAELGMGRAAGGAEACSPGWVAAAVLRLRAFAKAQVGVFSIEQARTVLSEELPEIFDQRAWGKATSDAHRLGYIEPVPRTFIPAASSNGTPKQAWRKGRAA